MFLADKINNKMAVINYKKPVVSLYTRMINLRVILYSATSFCLTV